jgi:cysteine synthase
MALTRFASPRSILAAARLARPLMPAGSISKQTRSLAGYVDSVTELIGSTPMVRLRRVIGEDCEAKVRTPPFPLLIGPRLRWQYSVDNTTAYAP